MGVIEEIKSLFRTGADIGDKFDKINTRSIARGAMEQSFLFSVLADDANPVAMTSALLQQLDRVYASWTQIYLSSIGFIDLNYIKNPKQFIARYQPQRLIGESSEDDLYLESGCDEDIKDHLTGDDEMMFEGQLGNHHCIALITPSNRSTQNTLAKAAKYVFEGYQVGSLGALSGGVFTEDETSPEDVMRTAVENQYKLQQIRDNAAMLRAASPQAPKMSDMDAKKLNDMQPYSIDLKLLAVKGDSSMSEWVAFTVGVKAWLHLATSDKIKVAIVDVLRNRNPIFNFIRWTTGELSLVKDIILNIDDINFDIANKSDRTGKYISSMREFKKRYAKVGTFGINRIAPFATIVLASSTYYDIKDNYGYDVKNMTFAKKIMNELFLMCFVIVDDANHTYDILVDGQADFQTYSLETLEREVALKSSKLSKELTRMLGSN